MHAFREHSRLYEVRSKLKKTPVQIHRFHIDAQRLERWLLKVLLNVAFEGRLVIGPHGEAAGVPPRDLVEIAFGHRRFEGKAGMYIGAHIGLLVSLGETFEFSPLVKDDHRILGGFFKIGDLLFYLCLEPEGIVVPLDQVPGVDSQWASAALNWRFKKIKATHGRYLSHVIHFNW